MIVRGDGMSHFGEFFVETKGEAEATGRRQH